MYRFGDVLWGNFPNYDGSVKQHPALVVSDPLSDGSVLVCVGTTKHVARGSAGGQVVLSPDRVPAKAWQQTGLREPSGFDLVSGYLVAIRPVPGKAGEFDEERVGNILANQQWVWDTRRAFQFALTERQSV